MADGRTSRPRGSVASEGGLATASKAFELALGHELDRLPYGAYQDFADAYGVSHTWVTRMRDPHDTIHVRASDAGRACAVAGSVEPINAVLRRVRIGGRRWHVVPAPEVTATEDLRLDSMELAGQAGAYVAAVGRALADGSLSHRERAELRQHLIEVRDQVEGLIAGLG